MISGIYGLLDPETGHLRYIGVSKDINKRYRQHCNLKPYGNKDSKTHLVFWLKSLNKYPELVILEQCPLNQIYESEIFWIAYYKSLGCKLVNHTLGGEGMLGYNHTLEARKKIGEASKIYMVGKKASPETKEKQKLAKLGTKQTKETIEKRKISNSGKKRSREFCINLGKRRKNSKTSEETKLKQSQSKNYKKIKIKDQFEVIYDSINDASKILNIPRYTIQRILKGVNSKHTYYRFTKI